MEQDTKRKGIKHLLECHCILPQYRNRKDTVFHKFVVFSIIDESDTVIPKYVQCNNCSAVHKVYDVCKSEIMVGRDELRTVSSIEDLRIGMHSDIQNILDSYKCDLPIWEHVRFLLDEEIWDSTVTLTKDDLDDETQGKCLRILSEDRFRIESFITTDVIGKK